ncbi:MAG: hypothetical protein QNJ85_03730 [Gammaproteobacteria bacterium]|nr:hypothetical protein [Gammaproteobacteria bacterium]
MTFFLRLRHWELFLMLALPTLMCLLFGLPFEGLILASIALFLFIVLCAWIFSIGAWSNAQLPPERRRGLLLFSAGLVLPIVYVLLYIILILPVIESGTPPDQPPLWIFPMHMLSMAGYFYGLWFAAKQFKSLLVSEDADFLIFSSMFFLLFIFPLGVWIIQPNVNQLYAKLDPGSQFRDEG